MQGRTLFRVFRPLLLAASAVLRLLPRSFSVLAMMLVRYIPTHLGVGMRYILLHRLSMHCGESVAVFEGIYLRRLHAAEFGDHISIHPMCYIDATGGLKIGSNVSIAHGTTIMTTTHNYTDAGVNIREAPELFGPVTIGSDVWIGAGVRILAGVSIGNRVVIGAGSVVTKDIPSNSLAVGVPARVVKSIE
jgi:acetyltransferase-like isoleucine patch superfamily enzyme